MYSIQLKDLTFTYPGSQSPVFQDVTINFEKGRSYAVIGPTGGGKSTLASIIAGLLDPSFGSVYLDGKESSSLSRDEITKKIGFILQEPYLMAGTVMGNIVYGNENLKEYFTDYEHIEKEGKIPLEKAESFTHLLAEKGLADLLEFFDEGLHTKIAPGMSNISLGQRQIINFLRVVLREPEILIMDEATANLDTITEAKLQKIIDTLPETTTQIIIAHRLNTVKNTDHTIQVAGDSVSLVS